MNSNLITGDEAWKIIEDYAKAPYPKSMAEYTIYTRMWEDSPLNEVTFNWALVRDYRPSKHQDTDESSFVYVEICVSETKPDKHGWHRPSFMWNSDKWYRKRIVLERVIQFDI